MLNEQLMKLNLVTKEYVSEMKSCFFNVANGTKSTLRITFKNIGVQKYSALVFGSGNQNEAFAFIVNINSNDNEIITASIVNLSGNHSISYRAVEEGNGVLVDIPIAIYSHVRAITTSEAELWVH